MKFFLKIYIYKLKKFPWLFKEWLNWSFNADCVHLVTLFTFDMYGMYCMSSEMCFCVFVSERRGWSGRRERAMYCGFVSINLMFGVRALSTLPSAYRTLSIVIQRCQRCANESDNYAFGFVRPRDMQFIIASSYWKPFVSQAIQTIIMCCLGAEIDRPLSATNGLTSAGELRSHNTSNWIAR